MPARPLPSALALALALVLTIAPAARADEGDCEALAARARAWLERLLDGPVEARGRAREALVRIGPSTRPLLVAALGRAGEASVREEIVRALGQLGDPSSREPLARVARAEDRTEATETRRTALLALGRLRRAAGVPVIREMLASTDPELRTAAREACLLVRGPGAVPLLIELLRTDDMRLRIAARDKLRRMTGESLPADADAWRRYWDDHRDLLPLEEDRQ